MPARDGARRRKLRKMPWLPWLIFQGRQVPGPRTPRDNPRRQP